ncbi:MAG: hypothetical protein JO316_24705 [Abitibacteriaceae bacterium]|nr:hypothetical protein [Abditibacteriaceae bacterium]MBV9868568.1 hypothetical protein [Abditibacteriaceae bacterium]
MIYRRSFNTGVIWVCRFTRSKGIREEIELYGDGTYRQTITDSQENIYYHSGVWRRHQSKAERLDLQYAGSQVFLRGLVDPLEVVRKQSVEAARKVGSYYPTYAFQLLKKQ